MHAVAVLCNLVSGAESTEAPNHRDFALHVRRDGELCVHDGVSQIGVFDASESASRWTHDSSIGVYSVRIDVRRCIESCAYPSQWRAL